MHRFPETRLWHDGRRQARIHEIDDRIGAGVAISQDVPVTGSAGQFRPDNPQAGLFQLVNNYPAGGGLAGGHRGALHQHDWSLELCVRHRRHEIAHV